MLSARSCAWELVVAGKGIIDENRVKRMPMGRHKQSVSLTERCSALYVLIMRFCLLLVVALPPASGLIKIYVRANALISSSSYLKIRDHLSSSYAMYSCLPRTFH